MFLQTRKIVELAARLAALMSFVRSASVARLPWAVRSVLRCAAVLVLIRRPVFSTVGRVRMPALSGKLAKRARALDPFRAQEAVGPVAAALADLALVASGVRAKP